MAEADLKFDEPLPVCITLAEEYLNSKTEFHSIGYTGLGNEKKEQFQIHQFQKTITYAPSSIDEDNICKKYKISDTSTKLLALAQEIEKNVQLFCQLEFLLRKIPINDTKDVDLKLITQSLVYKGSFLDADNLITHHSSLSFTKDTPLYHLGFVAYNSPDIRLSVICSKDTVAVCTLFVELCRDAGLENVALLVQSEENLKTDLPNPFDEHLDGCVGVVSARCDVDSAVDDLLAATTRYPWKLSSVLVQEAAMERFTRALEWKTRGAAPGNAPLVLEPAGDARGVRVEAFRTMREALSLLEARHPLAVAAWASDAAEANEIAFGARAALVWLNGHGHFRGPPAAAAAVFFGTETIFRSVNETYTVLVTKFAPWRELAPAARLERIRSVLDKFHARSSLRIGAVGLSAQSAIAVDRGVCVVTRTPVKFALIVRDYIEKSFTRFLNYLIEGGAVNVNFVKCINSEDSDVKLLCDLLSEAGVPVFDRYLPNTAWSPMYTIKAIWTSVGTIFAN